MNRTKAMTTIDCRPKIKDDEECDAWLVRIHSSTYTYRSASGLKSYTSYPQSTEERLHLATLN